MLLSSVMLVLRETLEAAMVISLLLAADFQRGQRSVWLPWGLAGGVGLAACYAFSMKHISQWFDYAGQELINAALQITLAISIVVYIRMLFRKLRGHRSGRDIGTQYLEAIAVCCAVTIVVLAITREGSEIIIFVGGFFRQGDNLQAVLIGSSIGAAIGASIGILIYYGIANLGQPMKLRIVIVLLAVFAGNMLSQSTVELAQVDWIPASRPLWNTDPWLPENSIPGQLLYALIGYESTPSLVQVGAYLAGVVAVLCTALFSTNRGKKSSMQTE